MSTKVETSPADARANRTTRAFFAALTTPSGLSVSVMVGVAAGLLLVFVLFVQWVAATGRADLFVSNPVDHQAFVTATIASLSDRPEDPPLLAIIGASVTRSSFGKTTEIADAYAARTGTVLEVVNLCTGRQPFLAQISLMENLPVNRPVTVILGLGPSRFTITREHLQELYDADNLAFAGPMELELAIENGLDPGSQTGIAVFDYGIFYVSRVTALARNPIRRMLYGRSVQQNEEQYIGRLISPEADLEHSAEVAKRFEDNDETVAMNRNLLEQIIALAKSRPNMTLILIEDPINPDFISNWLGQPRYDEHLAYMQGFASSREVAYWPLALEVGLSSDAFYDWSHISSDAAQVALRDALINRLSELEP